MEKGEVEGCLCLACSQARGNGTMTGVNLHICIYYTTTHNNQVMTLLFINRCMDKCDNIYTTEFVES